jgi:hypothetical protein
MVILTALLEINTLASLRYPPLRMLEFRHGGFNANVM